MATFGALIRSYRQHAGLGLRTFASLIDQRASTCSAIECGDRAPWRRGVALQRIADVLGIDTASNLWEKILKLAKENPQPPSNSLTAARLVWWWQTDEAPNLATTELLDLANFAGALGDLEPFKQTDDKVTPLTELAIEWRARRLLGRRETSSAAASVDVEAALENEAGVQIKIVPGLIPRFSVQACVILTSDGLTLLVDRIVADSRPMASYRQLLAHMYAPVALWKADRCWTAQWFLAQQSDGSWKQRQRDCERFALATLLPANAVLTGAEAAYTEIVGQQGWIEVDEAVRMLRNRLAEQFAVPTSLIHRRLVGWPCHLYGRVAQALAAQEPTLPPLDWLAEESAPRQQLLFDLAK